MSANLENPNGNTFYLRPADGVFLATEVGYKAGGDEAPTELPAKYAAGAWMFTKPIVNINDSTTDANYGFYFLAEQAVAKNLSLFMRFGTASGVNQIHANLAGGLVFNKITSTFDNDQLGFGFTTAWNSAEYLASQQTAGTPATASETALEVLYRFELIPGLAIQPDFQYVFNPGMDPTLKDTANFFIRFDISL